MATLKYKNPATSAWETLDALPAIGQTVEITATELAGKSTADRAAMYAAGTRLLKVVNGDTEVLLGLDADGSTEWLGNNKTIRNLLDNSDFEIAQAGYGGSHGAQAYACDRWKLISGTISHDNAGLALNGTIAQVLENAPSGPVTAAASAGTITYDASAKTVTIATTEATVIAWAALYEGSYTADTLPPYTPKGYAAELAECQRYYQRINASYPIMASGYTISTNAARIAAQLQNIMRIAPTVTVDATKVGIIYNGQYLYAESANWSTEVAKKKPIISADMTLSGAPFQGLGYPIITYLEADIDVSADL